MEAATAGTPSDGDAALVRALRDGSPAGLDELARSFAPRIYRVAYGITRNAADAEEVVQDVLLVVLRKISDFEGKSALWTWIFRITTNAALVKGRGKRRALEVSLEQHLPTFRRDGHREGDSAALLHDWSHSPEEELLTSETRVLLERAIEGLPEPYRAVLILRDVEELSNEEVAGILGESVACVKSRLHRARMAVREQLARHVGLRRGGGR